MSLLSETLVDEWLNRKGFLTMRGIKMLELMKSIFWG